MIERDAADVLKKLNCFSWETVTLSNAAKTFARYLAENRIKKVVFGIGEQDRNILLKKLKSILHLVKIENGRV